MSRIGKRPIKLLKNIRVSLQDNQVIVEGPKGKLDFKLPDGINVLVEPEQIITTRVSDSKRHKSLHGLARSIINNMIIGVHEGFSKILEIVGVGYKAQVQGKNLTLQMGLSHPVNYPIPPGITIETPKPTSIVVKGIDKFKVGQVTAEIRAIRPPEPYKGKGIRYAGEYVRRKAGKAVASSS